MNHSEKRGLPRLSFNAPVVLGFTAICFVAMLLNRLTGGASNRLVFSVYRAPLTDPLTWVRFFGHIFGHADWNHLINNMMYILILGPMLEEKYGSRDLAIIMAVAALLTGLIYYLFVPRVMLLGASGVVFAMILLASITRTKDGAIPLTFILVAIIYIGQQVWLGLTANDNVAYLGHIIGGAVGAGLGLALNRSGS